MPKSPKGEKRSSDAIGAAIKVAKTATGEIEEDIDDDGKSKAAVELGRKGREEAMERGIRASEFVKPWEWRRRKRLD